MFTESSVSAGDINAQILGGAAHLTVQSDKGALLTEAHGKLDLDNLNKLAPHPLLRRVHGTADWKAAVRVQNKLVDVTVDSDLQGIRSDLPAPLSKNIGERVPLHLEQKSLNLRQQTWGLSYRIAARCQIAAPAREGWNLERPQRAHCLRRHCRTYSQ